MKKGAWKPFVACGGIALALGIMIWWFAKGSQDPATPTAPVEAGSSPVYRASEESVEDGSLLPPQNTGH